MHPLFIVFGREIAAYTLFTFIGAGAAFALALPALKREGMSTGQAVCALVLMCVAFLVGARIWNIAVNPWNFMGDLKWYSLRLKGLSMYGGVFGAGLILLALLRLWKKPVWPMLDAMAVPGGVSFCIARVGCFLNGCCTGKATTGPFGVIFPSKESGQQAIQEMLPFLQVTRTVHPTQLYELLGAAVGIPVVILICRRLKLKDGSLFLLYGAWFSAVRLAVLPLRVFTYADGVKEICYPLLYGALILLGIVFTMIINRRPRAEAV